MYKYTQVLIFLAYYQGIFCWNFDRIPNSIRHFNSYPELNPLDDDNSEPDNWVYGNNDQTRFIEPQNDFSSRISFPEDDQVHLSNNRYKEENTHPHHFFLKCIRSCSRRNEYRPVCGTDDITYYNLEHLQCVRGCGDDVELQYASACNDFTRTSTSPPTTRTRPSPPTTTTSSTLELCLSLCPTTSEYNPVCGTDNVTYKNIGKLSCAQVCGVGVEVKRQLPCPKNTVGEDVLPTEAPIETTTINRRYFHSCMDSCPTTTEYKPVCASNGKTFYNTGKFQCAKSCGLDISIQALGVCEINQSGESETISSTTKSITTTPHEVSNKEPVTDFQNLLDKIFTTEDPRYPVLDVRHS